MSSLVAGAEDDEGREIVEMNLVEAPSAQMRSQARHGSTANAPAAREGVTRPGTKRRADPNRSVHGLGEMATIAKLRNMFMGNVTAMQSYDSMMAYDKDAEHIKLTPQQIKKVRAAFDLYDEDKSGAISADEMTKCLEALGHKLSPAEIADLFRRIDSDGNGEIEFDEFALIMSRRMVKDDWIASMRASFDSFDKDGSGAISIDELREVLVQKLGQNISDAELNRIVKLADANGDGEIDFDEFKTLMHTEQVVGGNE